MIHNVGFYCSGTISERGPVCDMVVFFALINDYVVRRQPKKDYSLIMDRFYKRYLKWEELELALQQIKEIKKEFSKITSHDLNWSQYISTSKSPTKINIKQYHLGDIFSKYFERFADLVEDARFDMKKYGVYNQPLRIVVSDIPEFYDDKERTLEEYDNLDGDPFWMRTPDAEFSNVEKITGDGSEEINVYTLNNSNKK